MWGVRLAAIEGTRFPLASLFKGRWRGILAATVGYMGLNLPFGKARPAAETVFTAGVSKIFYIFFAAESTAAKRAISERKFFA